MLVSVLLFDDGKEKKWKNGNGNSCITYRMAHESKFGTRKTLAPHPVRACVYSLHGAEPNQTEPNRKDSFIFIV